MHTERDYLRRRRPGGGAGLEDEERSVVEAIQRDVDTAVVTGVAVAAIMRRTRPAVVILAPLNIGCAFEERLERSLYK